MKVILGSFTHRSAIEKTYLTLTPPQPTLLLAPLRREGGGFSLKEAWCDVRSVLENGRLRVLLHVSENGPLRATIRVPGRLLSADSALLAPRAESA